MVEHPLSERVAWRSVWRLLLALSALLLAGWSVGASDRNPWTPATTAAVQPRADLPPVPATGTTSSSDVRAVASRPAVWTPAVAGLGLASPVESPAPVAARAHAEPLLQARSGERNGARAAEFDGLSIVLAVLALLILVGWRRRDQVLR